MNTITKAQRQALLEAALALIDLDETGEIAGGLAETALALAGAEGVSRERAERAVARAARIKRHPDYHSPSPGRPILLEAGEPVTVYLPAHLRSLAERIGEGNVSEGVREALSLYDR